ncbi:chitin binding Peritrophin-A domain protein [Dictyocaulus viviparus]|uniref:Chitin binding Peritrophin-A domain protein n=1 Tax=Dictyocaulus viviparus TaxID=29172 RepID=A0A0D8XEW2_DICVI|nr:chitin binding Peritrophin-A domain protein [Dictyocaulus viviparus]
MKGECIPVQQIEECREYDMNVLKEETRQLVRAEYFCVKGAGIYRGISGKQFDVCSRQAVICQPNRRNAISVLCFAGESLTENLRCVDAPKWCPSELDVTAPIRQFLLQRACMAASRYRIPNSKTLNYYRRNQFQPKMACTTWYVMCNPQPITVRCEDGKIFDHRVGKCRTWRLSDQCVMSGTCSGREWQSVPLEKCGRQFIYCEGSVAMLDTCEEGMVFDGNCKRRETVERCGICEKGDRKPGNFCSEYYECTQSATSDLGWELRRCNDGESFNDQLHLCQKNYTCPTRTNCIDGISFHINCRDYMYCTGERYEVH